MGIWNKAWKVGKEAFKKQKTTGTEVIKKIEPAKNLADRRKAFDEMVDTVKTQYEKVGVKQGSEASKIKKGFWRKSADIHDKYEKDVKALKKAKSTQIKKTVGAAGATVAGAVGAHGAAKKKWPKYKKVMESSVTIKDGKLGLRPKKKKD